MKKLSILIISLCFLLGVGGCNKGENKEGVIEEGKNTPPVNLIITSNSKYFTESEFINEENSDDGYYKQSYKYENIEFVLERMKHKEYSDFPVYIDKNKIYDLKYSSKNINDEMNMDLSYAAIKGTYMAKVNNEEIFNEDILISSEQWDFRIHLATNMNNYEENSSIIEDIVKNIRIEEVS